MQIFKTMSNQITKEDFNFMVKVNKYEAIKEDDLIKSLEKHKDLINKSTTEELSEQQKAEIEAIKIDLSSYTKYDVLSKSETGTKIHHEAYFARPKQIEWKDTEEIIKSEDGQEKTIKKRIGTYIDTRFNQLLRRVGQTVE